MEYARSNKSFGLATLRNRHVKLMGRIFGLSFAVSGWSTPSIYIDRRLARIIKRWPDLPGYELFQYVDENGALVAIEASDVNEYLKRLAGAEFSTKDFAQWADRHGPLESCATAALAVGRRRANEI